MYSGAIVDSYDFDLILNAAKNLKEQKIKFIIRGKGELKEDILDKISKEKLTNVSIDDTIVPYEKISSELSKADVFLIPMKNENTLNMSLPTKILEYQSIGRPIICCSSGAPGNFVEKTKSGVKLEYGDVDGFIKCILELEKNPELCQEMGKNGRLFIEENLTFEKIGERLADIIE
jgi:glycosyltransferase involved in cell wall biosynthesis